MYEFKFISAKKKQVQYNRDIIFVMIHGFY